MTVDLFEIHDFLLFLNKSYPKINITARYDFASFTLCIQISPKFYHENVEYYSGQSSVFDTKTCISHINDAFTAYLAYLSHRGIKL